MGRSNGDFGAAPIAAGFQSGKKDIKKSAYLYLMGWGARPALGPRTADLGGRFVALGHALNLVAFAAEQRDQPVLAADMGGADGNHRRAVLPFERLLQRIEPIAIAAVDEKILRLGTVFE